jgi:hypothetical protein
MKLRASRIVLGAVLLAALAGEAFWWDLHRAGPARAADAARTEASFPVFDIASPSARHTAAWLMAGPDNLVDGQWLGAQCGSPLPWAAPVPETFVMTREGPADKGAWRDDRLVVTLRDDSARAEVRRAVGKGTVSTTVTLDATDTRAFRRLVLDSAFLRLPPGARLGYCHTEVITMEWCSQGRYYGVMRMCEVYRDRAALTDVADAVDAFVARRIAR